VRARVIRAAVVGIVKIRRSACDHDLKRERAAFGLPFLLGPNIRVKRCFVMWSIDFGRTGRYRTQSHVVSFLSVA